MNLFQPNNLSRSSPDFVPVSDPVLTRPVTSLLEAHYTFLDLRNLKLLLFSGANVSSRNLKLEAPSAKFFLKLREQSSVAKMTSEAELTFALSELGQKVPRIIRSSHGDLVSVHKEKCCVLYEFADGDYFSGKGNELQAAAEAFGELTLAAKRLFPAPPTQIDTNPHRLQELLNLSERESAKYPDVAELCATHRTTILESLAQIEAHRELLSRPCVPMHLDYHPLNLLMRDGEVACIVDLEHLQPYPIAVGLGFAAYKLIRQAMVNQQPAEVSTWLRGWQKSFPDDRVRPAELGLGARCRILTLITLILDAALIRDDDRFNYDLEKQILSLYEVDVIFGSQRGT